MTISHLEGSLSSPKPGKSTVFRCFRCTQCLSVHNSQILPRIFLQSCKVLCKVSDLIGLRFADFLLHFTKSFYKMLYINSLGGVAQLVRAWDS